VAGRLARARLVDRPLPLRLSLFLSPFRPFPSLCGSVSLLVFLSGRRSRRLGGRRRHSSRFARPLAGDEHPPEWRRATGKRIRCLTCISMTICSRGTCKRRRRPSWQRGRLLLIQSVIIISSASVDLPFRICAGLRFDCDKSLLIGWVLIRILKYSGSF